jgi:hypothetical protein
VDWKEVVKREQNGIILGYYITYTKVLHLSKTIPIPAATFDYEIPKLSVWTPYNVSVAAYTIVGSGPAASVQVSTEEGGDYTQKYITLR